MDHLCEVLGADLSIIDGKGNSPLWVALRSRQESIASKLVRGQSFLSCACNMFVIRVA